MAKRPKRDEIVGLCEDKIRQTLSRALKGKKRMEEKHLGQKFTAYNCWICGRYHVGHQKGGGK